MKTAHTKCSPSYITTSILCIVINIQLSVYDQSHLELFCLQINTTKQFEALRNFWETFMQPVLKGIFCWLILLISVNTKIYSGYWSIYWTIKSTAIKSYQNHSILYFSCCLSRYGFTIRTLMAKYTANGTTVP